MKSRLRVCINASANAATHGGVGQVVIGLAAGLSELRDGDEEYIFLVPDDLSDALSGYLTGPCKAVSIRASKPPSRIREALASSFLTRGMWRQLSDRAPLPELPLSDGTAEKLGAQVVHFPSQGGFRTEIPSVYQPHDLQHLHLPEFFTTRQIRGREKIYRSLCARAGSVAVVSSWVKEDLVSHYGMDPGKIYVVPYAPPTQTYPTPSDEFKRSLRARLHLPERFLFYPAQTWPHKNHGALVEALARAKKRGETLNLICTGTRNEHYPAIRRRIEKHSLESQVMFLDFVAPEELVALYHMARAVVIPSRFEAASFPMWEAFAAGTPVACSSVTSLPRQAGGAALLFDPTDYEGISQAALRLWKDNTLCAQLAEKGREQVRPFTWTRTARHFRAIYRLLAGRPLDVGDAALLAEEPLM